MPNSPPAPLRNAGSTFGSFTPGQKVVTLVTVLALAIGGFFFATWTAKPAYAPLFSNLSSKDASAIVESLQGSGTTYQLADGGQTIRVPQDQVYDLRLQLSGDGLPGESDTGYALLDQQGITTSDFMQHTNYQRALEGELSNTIKAIDGVQAATVRLVMPQKAADADERNKTTASVLVQSARDKPLSNDQVQAVVHLVASSVEGLDPKRVTVAGADGRILSTGGGAAVATGTNSQTVAYQNRLNASLQNMLDSVVGPGHAVVTTTAELNFDQTETKREAFTQDPTVSALSESISREAYSGNGGTTQYERSRTIRNNAINKTTQTIKAAPGGIKKLNVAVLLDATTAGTVDPAQVQQLISVAAGIDATRGDSVAVAALPFDTTAASAAKDALAQSVAAEQAAKRESLIKTGGLVLIVLVLLFVAWRAGRRAQKRKALVPAQLAHLRHVQATATQHQLLTLNAAIPSPSSDGSIRHGQQRDIEQMATDHPEEMAALLRGWLGSGQ